MLGTLHRLVLFCRDTEQSKAWYEKVGFAYKHGYDGMHWFSLDAGELMLHPSGLHPRAAAGGSDAPPGGGASDWEAPAVHVAVEHLDRLFARVKEQGMKPYDHQVPGVELERPVVRPWGEREFELSDPDGHRWVFTEVLPRTSDPSI